ncbi:MAG: methylenetetrahydrofolate reductase [Acidobacteriota bacterium]|jgi:5,10-methylenetetrahydrofolate reductase
MSNQIAERVKQYALNSTYEISCLTNMAKVAEEVGVKGVTIPAGTMFSIVDKSTDPGTKDIDRVKTIERSAQLVKLGYRPIPHMAARRYKDVEYLRGIVQQLLDVGVDGFLLLAGDPKQPAGSFAAAMDMAATGIFDDARIKTIAFAGHPYGNPNTVAENTARELKRKNEWAAAHRDKEVFLWSQVCYSPSKFMRWLDQLDREGNKLPVHPGVMLGDVKAKFAFAHGNFVADRPFDQQIRGYMKMLGIGMAQGVDGIGSLMSTIPASFFAKMADRAATDKRVAATHYYSGFGAAAVKQALEVNHKFATGQFSGSGTSISMEA